jgi:hypothetical protein
MTRDRLFLAPHWHIDCRLIAELPEDSVVGVRFITYAIPCVIALAAVLFTGWYGYADFILRQQINDWNQRLERDYWDVAEIRRQQRFYENEAKKIEGAYIEIKNPIFISGFISELGQTIPATMAIDSIDYGDGKAILRGRVREAPERASQLVGAYVEKLRKDPVVGPYYSAINITGLSRSNEDEQVMVYEITLHLKPRTL